MNHFQVLFCHINPPVNYQPVTVGIRARFGSSMASSVTKVGNPQQGGKKSKDKNKELAVLVDDRVAEINASIITLTGRVDEMEKRIEEVESEGDLEELRGEMQVAVNSVVADVNKEVLALRASEATPCLLYTSPSPRD